MIDVHSHITFGLDDGAKNLNESIEMAKLAVKEGIKTIIATPHHGHPLYSTGKEDVVQTVEILREQLQLRKIPLDILIGQEIRLFEEIDHALLSKNVLSLNDTEYVLVELPSSHIPKYVERLFYDLLVQGNIPIIAHPERNAEIVENPDKLYRLVKNGALSQVTTAAVAGKLGKKIQKLSLQLIEYDLSHLIASDAHNTTNRSFFWQEALKVIEKKLGSDKLALLETNSVDLISNSPLTKNQPTRIPDRRFMGIF
ncbi:tyrosine-protein phosphatase [Chungangia koreensis]|uniref:Tyrosine-protein phosphatase n=1 Tax=Chungangia koreensis TaxID=752657 RepID=A0ABV8X3H9_9LACT